jgi:type IV pilus assembly protein PilY1
MHTRRPVLHRRRPSRGTRWLARTLAALIALPHVAGAAQFDLSDVPMYLAGRPKPNLMMAYDDSGSMDFEVSIAGTVDGALWWRFSDGRFYGRNGSDGNAFDAATLSGPLNVNPTNDNAQTYQKYAYLFPNGLWNNVATERARRTFSSSDHAAIPPTREFAFARSADYNAVYYNPNVRYLPWGPANNGTATYTFANATPTAVESHPLFTASTSTPLPRFDLTQNVDQSAADWTFKMYPGMILPAGAYFQYCYRDNGDCRGGWIGPTSADQCLVRSASGNKDANGLTLVQLTACSHAQAPVTTSSATLDLSGAANSGQYPNFVDVRVPYYPATYYVKDSSLTVSNADARGPDGALLRRVEIRPANAPFPKGVNRSDCAAATSCTYDEEMQNFANWFGYYRKRQLMMNASISQAFTGVANLRAGFFRFNNRVNATMYDVDATADSANLRRMLDGIYSIKSSGGTPTRESLNFMGNQFKRTDSGRPITSSCQFNAGFVITDGYPNALGSSLSIGNYDAQTNYTSYPWNRQYSTTGATNTNPYTDTQSDSLGDIAMKFFTENLRPDLPAGKVKFNAADTSPNADRNPNLHMNTYALGINLTGTIFGVNAALTADPFTNTVTWPTGTVNANYLPGSIDELWHATINGRGRMFSAATPEETRNALLDVIDDVVGRDAAGSAVAVSNPVPVLGDNTIYYSEFRSGTWSGDLNGYAINVVTGAVNAAPGSEVWQPSPQRQLAARTPGSRVIATYTGSAGVPLRWASLPAQMQTALTPSWLITGNTGADMLEFLRGERAKEGVQFRSRGPRPPFASSVVPENVGVLGDIVNAEPVVVGPPAQKYADAGYAAFRTAQASRPRVVYQGANDGMLHAFNATNGAERWAYMPGLLFRMPQTMASPLPTWPYVSSLTNLGQRVGFGHRFYVDGTPVSGDVDTACAGSACGGSYTPAWRTLLVGGLRKGGFGYYALDVTDPAQSTESGLATNVVRWEFPNASTSATVRPNVGYSYGRPIIAKTEAAGWVVLVTSGYNNGTDVGGSGGNGQGYLFVLNAATGDLIRAINTGVGTATDPSGLAAISAWSENAEFDATVSYVYGGDLKGNVWRFDLTGTSTSAWSVTRLAELRDASNNPQPVMDEPELTRVNNDRFVYVGTGRYLGLSDVPGAATATASATFRHTMYGLKDDLTSTTIRRSDGVLNVVTATRSGTGAASTVSLSGAVTAGSRGWALDLPQAGERVDTSPQLILGALTFTSNVPAGSDPCEPQGNSYFWQLDASTGNTIAGASYTSRWVASAISSRPIGVQVAQGYRSYVNPTEGGVQMFTVTPPNQQAPGKRKSWRELSRN